MTAVDDLVAHQVRRRGPVPFAEVVDLALYHPDAGFYASGGRAGRRGDFLTSPEVGPLFGAVLAGALDRWWRDLGSPDPFVVVEAGAGTGALARSVLAADPACAPALRYVLVERSTALRAAAGDRLQLTPPAFAALGPTVPDASGAEHPVQPGVGPLVGALPALPAAGGPAVVLANELLDNLAFGVLERLPAGWAEVRVGLATDDHALTEVLVPASEDLAARATRLAPDAPSGGRIPVQDAAAGWLRDALELVAGGGRVVAFDYATTTPALATRPWSEWLRTYAGHERGAGPLERLGTQDITVEVCVDQLARVHRPDADRSQATFLTDHAIDDLVAEGRRIWAERAHLGDLTAVAARSRVGEAEALCDPDGLGAFRVLEWEV